MSNSKVIEIFLLSKKGYLKKGNHAIQIAIAKKYGTVHTIDAIREAKKKVKKELKQNKVPAIEQVVEDFRENARRLEDTPFAPTPRPTRQTGIVRMATPSIEDQVGMHILMGCNHVPFHHVQLHEGVKRLIKDHKNKIKGFHLLGDFLDLNPLSSHDKGRFTAVPGLTLNDEYDAGNTLLDEFDAILPDNVWKTYLYGNHEDRYNRWMSNMDNAKTPLVSPAEALGLMDRGYHTKTRWSQDYFTLGNDFEIFHGIYFSIHNAKAHLDKLRTSCAYVHTHRIQNYREGKMAAFNIGACADFTTPAFNYATRPMKAQWANGFAINMIDSKGNSNITQINVNPDGHFWFGGVYY
jgi:hypothetical protein